MSPRWACRATPSSCRRSRRPTSRPPRSPRPSRRSPTCRRRRSRRRSPPLAVPALAAVPFLVYLLVIAAMPLVLARFWDHNRNKLAVALAAALPVAIYLVAAAPGGAELLADTAREYAAFIALLGALFVITA